MVSRIVIIIRQIVVPHRVGDDERTLRNLSLVSRIWLLGAPAPHSVVTSCCGGGGGGLWVAPAVP